MLLVNRIVYTTDGLESNDSGIKINNAPQTPNIKILETQRSSNINTPRKTRVRYSH